MTHGPGDDAKERVRQATDIVDLIGGYLQLRRQGRNYVGLCPWHDDTRPSMQVNPDRQTFKCWVCDIGGDVFSFMMKIDGLEFREALETLAERSGITLTPPRGGPARPAGPGDKQTLLAAAAWAAERFHKCLTSDPLAAPARRYLAGRGLTEESIRRFRIGFAPDRWDWLLNAASGGGFSPAVLQRVGLLRAREGGGHYDFYRGRVMFPICDLRGQPIAFGGRILPELAAEGVGKYFNSPETPLFSKSNTLYGLDLARDGVASTGRVVVTEGYTDVVMAHQHGVTNVVAVLGTALGERHLPVLRRFSDSIVLVLDGDEAGRRRTGEVLELFVAKQVDLRVLGLPDGADPCDFIAKPKEGPDGVSGAAEFNRLVESAPDALEYKIRAVTKGLGMTDHAIRAAGTHAATRAVEAILATLSRVAVGVGEATSERLLREQNVLSRLARRFALPEESLRRRLGDLRRDASRRAVAATPPAAADPAAPAAEPDRDPSATATPRLRDLPPREAELLELLLAGAETAQAALAAVAPDDLTSDAARRIYWTSRDTLELHGEVDFHRLMDASDEAIKSLLVEIDAAAQAKPPGNERQRVADLASAFRAFRDRADRQHALSRLRAGGLDTPEEEAALSTFFQKLRHRQAGSPSTDG